MNRIVLSTGLAAAALVAADHLHGLQQRVAELERAPRADPEIVRAMSRELGELRGALAAAREAIESDDTVEHLGGRLAVVASMLEREKCAIAEHDARLAGWESRWSGHAPEAIDGRIDELSDGLAQRQRELEELRRLSAGVVAEGRARIEELRDRVEPLLADRDVRSMWHELVGPVVQLAGDTTVGSGVLLESQERNDGSGWTTYVLTSWHVVRDIYGTLDRTSMPVPVRMYEPDGSTRDEHATMVAFDVPLDVAMLKLDLDRPVPHGARLAPPEDLARTAVFDPIYAVGCPLGNDPIPTAGEIAATHHEVDGNLYWMVSAPTYIGNSGGGIFDARTHELIGIFSKIYTHGSARSTIVPHMGLATPMTVVYEWLERAGCSALVRPAQAAPRTASAVR